MRVAVEHEARAGEVRGVEQAVQPQLDGIAVPVRGKDLYRPGEEYVRVGLARGEVAVAGDGVEREVGELALEHGGVADVVAQMDQDVGPHAPDCGGHAGGGAVGVGKDGEDHVYAPLGGN